MLNTMMYMLATGPSGISAGVRAWLEPTLMCVMVLLSIVTIVVIMMQKSQADNVSAISGETETFMGKHKGTNLENKLKRTTYILGALLLIISIVFFIVKAN